MTGPETPPSPSETQATHPSGALSRESGSTVESLSRGQSAIAASPLRIARRTLLAIACIGAFLGVASFIKPAPRQAAASIPNPVELAIPVSALGEHPKGWKLLGTLQGKKYLVRAYASPEGPRYSVYSTLGRLIQGDLPADEVYRAFPEADLKNMQLEPGVPSNALMLHSGAIGD